MLVRLIIWIALGSVGFAGGELYFRGEKTSAKTDTKKSLAAWSTSQPSALLNIASISSSDEAKEAIKNVRQTSSSNLGAAMIDCLQLVKQSPIDQLETLMIESERSMPESDIGGVGYLMREAITERLITEDPDRLLNLLLTSQSDHLADRRHSIMLQLREKQGFDTIVTALQETQYPLRAHAAMQALLNGLDDSKAPSFEQLIADKGADSGLLWRVADTEQRIDLALEDPRFNSHHLTSAFTSYYVREPEKALSKIEEISSPTHQRLAVEGIGRGWTRGDVATAQEFAAGLGADQMRVAFLASALKVSSSRNIPGAGKKSTLNNIIQLEPGAPRTALLEQELRQWKQQSPEQARKWAEENQELETFERLIPSAHQDFRPFKKMNFIPPGADE